MIQKSSIGEKILLMRKAEGLSRREVCVLTGISPNNLKNYERLGRQIPAETLILLLNNDVFHKYKDWLMFDRPNPAAGQIAPPLSPDGYENSEVDQISIETTQKSPR
ncbi:helix-turn-helix transcriptional regulator [Salmonella enterica]|nr:XRE family transcriptional regulator [Salmonella enterica]EBQ9479533.1 XRE family transcriptional regulator [Salmonella enterica subsp. enterica serovar Kokomlemle]ECD3472122.1 XRE family transcriptional regulator [Salmonella enterica subsp. enterica serovar Oranienburg]EDS2896431.1 helix-turn-helix transcriptional regulator [Salmonella enterica]EGG8579486.1 helix-turn-helix transcriptional regulator [Salmonella enterica]